jgi:hypothetical protein
MSPACRNCDAHVTAQYIRVHSRDGQGVDCCPHCPDRTRRRGGIVDARGTRRANSEGPGWERSARQEGQHGD